MSVQDSYSRPALENIRALVTTKWKRGYSQRVIRDIESFFVDSSLDNDSDNWEVVIGDPRGDFLAMLERNHEVRVELISSSRGDAGHIFTGISDDIIFIESGTMTVGGRDFASLALDSICPPCRFKGVKPAYVVHKQARELGFTNISLAINGQVKKTIKTDGSETFWEFWYRLYRQEDMWLWVGPNGALVGSRLHYNAPIAYYFGTPKDDDSIFIQRQHIRVEGFEVRKSTQGRVGKVFVVHTGKHRIPLIEVGDPTTKEWMKRPNKIITDTVSRSPQKAKAKALEEIFEGKIGSLEIRLTISEPGHIIRPNRMCRVRMPEYGYAGEFFIVGTKIQAGPAGYLQEVRLREKSVALSRRKPAEPSIPIPNSTKGVTIPGTALGVEGANEIFAGMLPEHPDWGKYFWEAAHEFHDGWNEDLFWASLLGTCYLETGFKNIREYTGHFDREIYYEWKPPDVASQKDQRDANVRASASRSEEELRREYQMKFCNSPDAMRRFIGYDFNRGNDEAGVGPMQLTSLSLKHDADNHMREGFHDEYAGGRWYPKHNIWAAAKYFLVCLRATGISPTDANQTQEEAMWQAGALYKGGTGGDKFSARHDLLRRAVLNTPGFLKKVRATQAEINENAQNRGVYSTDGTVADKLFPQGWPNEAQCLAAYNRGLWLGPYQATPSPPFQEGKGPLGILAPIWLAASSVNYKAGRDVLSTIKWIAIHTSEYPQKNYTARAIANQFAGNKGPGGAHYSVDNAQIYQSVREQDTAYGAQGLVGGISVNAQTIHVEHAGYAGPTPAASDWSGDYSQEMLNISAKLVAEVARKWSIPVLHLSPANITAGSSGIVGHDDLVAASGSGDHHDPGTAWPWTDYIALVNTYMT